MALTKNLSESTERLLKGIKNPEKIKMENCSYLSKDQIKIYRRLERDYKKN